MSRQREVIARSLTSGFSRKVWDGDFNPSPDPKYNKQVREHVRANYLNDADLIIAHLWSRADDPTVVEAATRAHHDYLRHPDRLVDGFDNIMFLSAVIQAALTALLGPRPNGEEAEHGH